MKLKLVIFFLALIVYVQTEDAQADIEDSDRSYYHTYYKDWHDRIAHLSHQIARPMPAPTLITSWEIRPVTDLNPGTTIATLPDTTPAILPVHVETAPPPITIRPEVPRPTRPVETVIIPAPKPRPTVIVPLEPLIEPQTTAIPPRKPLLPPRPIPRPVPIPSRPIEPKPISPLPIPTILKDAQDYDDDIAYYYRYFKGWHNRIARLNHYILRPMPPPTLIHSWEVRPVTDIIPRPTITMRPPQTPTHAPIPRPTRPLPIRPTEHTVKPTEKSIIPYPPKVTDTAEILLGYDCKQVNGYYLFNNECETYVECNHNTAYKIICPDGLHFNPDALWPAYPCGYPKEVSCENRIIRHSAQPTEACPRQYGYFPLSDNDCSRYIMCQEGLATIMNCPAGLVFNPDLDSCDWPVNVPSCNPDVFQGFTCPEAPLEEDGQVSDFIFKYRHGKSCKYYVACQHDHPRLLSCDPGFYFDEVSKACVDSEYVNNCEADSRRMVQAI